MATKTKKRSGTRKHKKPAGATSNYRKNPGRRPGSTHHRRMRRRHNTGGAGLGNIGALVTNAVFVIAGALGSKLLTQMVLQTNNTGFMGYAGNAIAGFGLWLLASKVLKNNSAAAGVAAGTAVQVVLRLINDYTPFGQYISQLGMGDYQAQAFVTPQLLVDPFNSARIRIPGAWQQPAALPAPSPQTPSSAAAAAGVGSYGGGNLYGGQSNLY